MKVKGTQTTVETVDIEIGPDEIQRIIDSQSVGVLADAIQRNLYSQFLEGLKPSFNGKRAIGKSYSIKNEGRLALIHIDEDWDHHHNVGVDKEVRILTSKEVKTYNEIREFCNKAVKMQFENIPV